MQPNHCILISLHVLHSIALKVPRFDISGMVWVVSFSLYMGIGAKSQNRLATDKTSLYRVKHTTDML